MPPRRPHTKSRQGCAVCKRRRIKCDENRPTCTPCTNSARECEYPERDITFMPSASTRRRITNSPVTSLSSQVSPGCDPENLQGPSVNMLHIELLHQLATETLKSLHENVSDMDISLSEMMKHSLTAPYLINELLALAALHLSTICAQRRDFYRHHAIQLQTHALRIFHEMNSEVNSETVVPLFLFTSFLGLHMLCDTLINRGGNFDEFLDNFVHYLRVHRGSRTVIGAHWDLLAETPLWPILQDQTSRLNQQTSLDLDCNRLFKLIRTSGLDPSTSHNYEETIETLRLAKAPSKNGATSLGIFTWPVVVPSAYIDLLAERKPEALVILSHYAILLHSRRDTWMFSDAGQFMIQSINQQLGPEWADWLTGPNFALASCSTTGAPHQEEMMEDLSNSCKHV
ncbi:Zn(II)2Cys6 transcription factor domain-containing protein [Aspergillus affinis]|uniref:Zn(II)2Cys6 transcription factor domain-containing protein n=1 Tax=Aspergillus affinis TaxID=1070780 RepID=UPI0022FDD7A3|nr:uncharacterized protein KD926_004691 [Aspergillus affinis]KAI9035036.1 hypothetical protein KD926_004691 [Aspergillus affinis]